jgi:hypothetical protein
MRREIYAINNTKNDTQKIQLRNFNVLMFHSTIR